MLGIVLALALQSAPPAGQSMSLPVSLDKVRAGVEKPARFAAPPPRPWRGLVFRTSVQKEIIWDGVLWEETWMTPPWVRPTRPPAHFEFLQQVTPEEVRSSTLYPCCNVTSAIGAAAGLVKGTVRKVKEKRAKREVEDAMKAAGIRR